MSDAIPTILDDARPISAIWFPEENQGGWFVADRSKEKSVKAADRIVTYPEPGPGGLVPFFAVYRDGQIEARVPAWQVEVRYAVAG